MFERYLSFAARGRVLLVCFIGTILLTICFQVALRFIGGDLIDTHFWGYDFAQVMALMEAYGPEGRWFYVFMSPTLDTLFPLVYGTFYVGLVHALRPLPHVWWFALFPLACVFADFGENAQIVTMLIQYPDITRGQVAAASFTTILKTLFLWASALTILAFLMLRLVRWARSVQKN